MASNNGINSETLSQPDPKSWSFVRDLQQEEKRKLTVPCDSSVRRVVFHPTYSDATGLLASVHREIYNLPAGDGGEYQVVGELDESLSGENYRIAAEIGGCRITAGTIEGIRRGLYRFADEWFASEGQGMAPGIYEGKFWLHTRISRCFFGPIKRPPLNRDELLDDVDYYPEAYLARLARSGINGLWLTVSFRDLCSTSITPHYGIDAPKRFAKLRATVERCRKFGIRIYLFAIEPAAWQRDDPALLTHPELGGATFDGLQAFCPGSPAATQYLREAVGRIFTEVPDLGGMIQMLHGERPTHCVSSVPAVVNRRPDCPVCGSRSNGESVGIMLQTMFQAMREKSPNAEWLAWIYSPQPTTALIPWVTEIPPFLPKGMSLQYNFESGISHRQLGRERIGGDYWLSRPGPGKRFEQIAEAARHSSVPLAAKIQVGCSHEVATVPHVPVPGLLYRKYRAMKKLGVSSVMQCWFFGNYPGVMNRAAGMLAQEDFAGGEMDFLRRLAGSAWGKYASMVATAWRHFGRGYSSYPLSNMFQYYGPAADGAVWPLYLFPAEKPLAPTWKLEFGTSGDAIGECLENHTIMEAIRLTGQMVCQWRKGMAIFRKLSNKVKGNDLLEKEIILSEALLIHFECAHAILQFYNYREKWLEKHNKKELTAMKKIVEAEINRSRRLAELAEKDSRLGFHSEAEGYKYFPAKLHGRAAQLERLLSDDFPRAQNGEYPAEVHRKRVSPGGPWEDCGNFRWRVRREGETFLFDVECTGHGASEKLLLAIWRGNTDFPCHALFRPTGKFHGADELTGEFTRRSDGFGGTIRFTPSSPAPCWRLNFVRSIDTYNHTSWAGGEEKLFYRLSLDLCHPAIYGYLTNQ